MTFLYCFTFTFMHLADAFIQSDLHCIQVTVLHLISFKNSNVTVFGFQFLYSFLNVLRLLFRKLCEGLAGSVAFFTDFFGVSVHIDLKRQCGISKSMRNEYKHTHTRTPSSQVCLSVSLHKSGRRGQCYRSAAVQCTCVYVCVFACMHVSLSQYYTLQKEWEMKNSWSSLFELSARLDNIKQPTY